MRFQIPEPDDDLPAGCFQPLIDRMAKADWIKAAIEADPGGGAHWTELGQTQIKEIAALREQRLAGEISEIECLQRLAPFISELGQPEMDGSETIKLLALAVCLTPD